MPYSYDPDDSGILGEGVHILTVVAIEDRTSVTATRCGSSASRTPSAARSSNGSSRPPGSSNGSSGPCGKPPDSKWPEARRDPRRAAADRQAGPGHDRPREERAVRHHPQDQRGRAGGGGTTSPARSPSTPATRSAPPATARPPTTTRSRSVMAESKRLSGELVPHEGRTLFRTDDPVEVLETAKQHRRRPRPRPESRRA